MVYVFQHSVPGFSLYYASNLSFMNLIHTSITGKFSLFLCCICVTDIILKITSSSFGIYCDKDQCLCQRIDK